MSLIGSLDAPKGTFYRYNYHPLYSLLLSIGYVEFRTVELVDKAIALSGTLIMGLPIHVQLTEAERNKLHAGDTYVFDVWTDDHGN